MSCTPIVDETCRLGRPVLISTGMSDDSAIDAAVGLADSRGCRAGLFQCTSEYPCPPEHLNLSTIRALEQGTVFQLGFLIIHLVSLWHRLRCCRGQTD